MLSMKGYVSFLTLFMASVSMFAVDKVKITVENRLSAERLEMAEMEMSSIRNKLGTDNFIVTDADGREIPSQKTYDGKLIFQVGVPSKGKSVYYAVHGNAAEYEPLVFGRQFLEYNKDIAWENNYVAFKCSCSDSTLNNKKESFGYDVLNKRTTDLVVEARYKNEFDNNIQATIRRLRELGYGDLADDVYNSISYYVDHGNGLDCYKSLASLGCGTSALLVGNDMSIQYPNTCKKCTILDNGPLRFTFQMSFDTIKVDGKYVVEKRVLSLDANSHMNRVEVVYEEMPSSVQTSVGIVIHKENPYAYIMNVKDGYMMYEDLGDPELYKDKYRSEQNLDFGHTYIGVAFPASIDKMFYKSEDEIQGAVGHVLGVVGTKNQFTYYFGSAWNRNASTNIISMGDWESYLNGFAKRIKSPLIITVK